MVYNFRIAQITKQPIINKDNPKESVVVALIFDQCRKKNTGVFQNYAGFLGSFIYDFMPYSIRTDFAFSHIYEKNINGTEFTDIQTDDLLTTFARNFALNSKNAITLSILFGVPTHKILRLKHPDFGYNQIGTGLQIDGSLTLNRITNLIYGARYLYFVPRKAKDSFENRFKFTLGNVIDFLGSIKNTWQQHGFEIGYTSRFRFGARSNPPIENIGKRTDYIRSNFYAVYKYKFMINDIANRFILNLSYGFDHSPKLFGNKFIVTLWASWNISF